MRLLGYLVEVTDNVGEQEIIETKCYKKEFAMYTLQEEYCNNSCGKSVCYMYFPTKN